VAELVIPRRLAETSVAWEGERARAWLAELPRLVSELAEAWDLEVGAPYEPGGAVSWVAPCRRRSEPAPLALKLQLPHPESAPEAAALAAWGGRGAVRLEAHDAERSALLLERCDPGTPMSVEDDVHAAVAAGAELAARLHEAPVAEGVPELAEVMARWAEDVEARRPSTAGLDPAAVAIALETLRSAGETDQRVLLHGDLNPTNVLRSARGWLAIDPKPMAGDPAFDGARVVLQLDPTEGPDPVTTFGARIRTMAATLGVEPERLGRWCVADVVERSAFAGAAGDAGEAARIRAVLPHVLPHAG
jgi:streptomycin 6-kinase